MRRILIVLAWLAFAGEVFATLLGFLAPWVPWLELINHFRPYLLVAAALVLVAAALLRHRSLILASAAFLAFTAALVALPFASVMPRTTEAGARLRVLTANVWVGNRGNETIARSVADADADIVLFQELGRSRMAALAPMLPAYPHVYCPDRTCDLGILSKRPWIAAGKEDVGNRRPLAVWARFVDNGFVYEVIGLHVDWPFHPETQARNIDWLEAFVQSRGVPLIVAGDFNLTPFSWKLTRFAHRTGLRRAVTLGASWPAHRLTPVVLLDNVFASPEFGLAETRFGPPIGSDHLPVIADLVRLP